MCCVLRGKAQEGHSGRKRQRVRLVGYEEQQVVPVLGEAAGSPLSAAITPWLGERIFLSGAFPPDNWQAPGTFAAALPRQQAPRA